MLYDADQLESLLRCDGADLLHFVAQGHVPAPVILSDRLVRWTAPSIDAWVAVGCPQGPALARDWYDLIRDLIWCERAARSIATTDQRKRVIQRKHQSADVSAGVVETKPRSVVTESRHPEFA